MKKMMSILILSVMFVVLNACGALNKEPAIPAVMINDNTYYRMNIGILGVEKDWTPDGMIQSEVSSDQYPKEHEQSNFGTDYEYQMADGLYGILVKLDEKIELFQLKDKGEFVYEDLVFEKADLTEKEFEWLSRYSLAEEEVRKNMKISLDLLEKGISVEEYR